MISKIQIFLFIVMQFAFAAVFSQNMETHGNKLFVKLNDNTKLDISYPNPEVKSHPGEIQTLLDKYPIDKIYCPFILNDESLKKTYLVEFNSRVSIDKLIRDFKNISFVEYAERVPLDRAFYTPNDQQGQQWNLSQIQAPLAWNTSKGNANIVVAIVDDAVLLSHQDLNGDIWTNTGEIPGNNIDDDGNGYIDDVNGWDAADNDNDPNPPATVTNSNFTHGTHCAGIAAASTDNATGIASIGFDTKIMPVKTKLSSTSGGSLQATLSGVQYAIASNADIISMSWGSYAYSQTYQNMFNVAHSNGIVLVAAAGNSNTSAPMYPASYNHVISVGATDQNDQKASFSNYGSTIDVMAPGVGIYSTLAGTNSAYGNMSGTSMACPLVSGLAALMLDTDPYLIPDSLESCLKRSCDNINSQNPSYVGQIGAGRINAYQALSCLPPIIAEFSSDFTQVCPGDTVQFSDNSMKSPTSWQWTFPGGTPGTSSAQNPVVVYPTVGNYDVKLVVSNAQGTDSILKTNYITVAQPSAQMSGATTISPGGSAFIKVSLTGNPPWDISYSDGSNTYQVNNITSSPYYIQVSPYQTTTYTLVSINDQGCSGSVSGSAIIAIGTQASDTCCSDTLGKGWKEATDSAQWTNRAEQASVIYDNKMWITGGHDGSEEDDVWYTVNGTNWVQATSNAPWTPRRSHECVSFDNKLWLLGGLDGSGASLNDVWYTTDGINWTQATSSAPWQTRNGFAAVVQADTLWVYGGYNTNTNVHPTDVWYTLDGINWTQATSSAPWVGRRGVGAHVYNGKIWLLGGVNSSSHLNDVWYSPDGSNWTQATSAAGWNPRKNHKSLSFQGEMWVLGGGSTTGYKNDVWSSTDGSTWTKVAEPVCWPGRRSHTAEVFNNKMWVHGGAVVSGSNFDNDVWHTQSCNFIDPCSSGSVKFVKTISGSLDEDPHGVIQTYDKGYAIVGLTNSAGAGLRDIYLTKMDSTGIIQWEKTYGNTGDDEGRSVYLIQTPDSGFFISGMTDSYGGINKAYLLKTDKQGNLDWENVIGNSGPEQGRAAVYTGNGSYFYVSGTDNSFGIASEGYLIKLDSSGNKVWAKTYGQNQNEHFVANALNASNHLYHGGAYNSASQNLFLVKTDTAGNAIWAYRYSGSQDETIRSIDTTSDNSLVITGRTNSFGSGGNDIFLMKVDSSGSILWSWVYGTTGNEDGRYVQETNDKGFVIYGTTTGAGSGLSDLVILKTDSMGNPLWAKAYGTSSNEDLFFNGEIGGQQTKDGGFVVAGKTDHYGGDDDIMLIKTDACGNSGCYKQDILLNVAPVSFSSSSLSLNINSGGNTTNSSTQVSSVNFSDSTSCKENTCPTQSTFFKLYEPSSNDNNDFAVSIIAMPGGDFVYGGITNSSGAGNYDVVLTRVNALGQVIWSKTYGGIADEDGRLGMDVGPDSCIVVASATKSFGASNYDTYFIKVDPNGNLLWENVIGSLSSLNSQFSRSLFIAEDTSVVMSGTFNNDSFTPGGSEGYVIKLDKNGNRIWSKTYAGTDHDHFITNIELSDGSYLSSGNSWTYGNSGTHSIWLVKTDTSGSITMAKSYYHTSERAQSVAETSDKSILLTGTFNIGSGNTDIFVTKLDSTGVFQWGYTFGGASDEEGEFIKELPDKSILIGGYTESVGFGGRDIFLLKLDSVGNVLWNNTYGTPGNENFSYTYTTQAKIAIANDGGFLFSGHTDYYGGDEDIFLVKANSCDGSSCISQPVQFNKSSITFNSNNITIPIKSPDNVASSSTVSANFPLPDTTICEFIPNPSPVSCNLEPNFTADTVCIGDSTSFFDWSIDSDTSNNIVYWKWYFDDGDSLTGVQNPKHLYAYADTFNVKLIIGNDDSPACFDTVIKPVIVLDTLTAFLPENDTICIGDSIQLGPVQMVCGAPPYTYNWTPGSGLTDSTIANPKASPTSSTEYYLEITDSLGVVARDSIKITIDSSCCVSYAQFGIQDTISCLGDSVVFTNLSSASGSVSYNWNFGTGASPSSYTGPNPPIVTYNNSGSYQVILILTDSCGTDTAQQTVTIAPLPPVFAGNDTTVCLGDTLQLGSSPVSTYSYQWAPNSVSNDTIANPYAVITGPISYVVTATDRQIGCTNSDTINIDTTTTPSVNLGNDTSLCLGDSIALDASYPGSTYQWHDGSSDSIYYTKQGGTYWVNVSNVCGSASDTVNITTDTIPTVMLGNDTTMCTGDSLILTAYYAGASYTWQDGSTDSSYTVTSTGTYWVNVSNICGMATDTVNINYIASPPSVNLGNDTSFCEGNSLVLDASYPGASYTWQDGASDSTYTVAQSGTYWVQVSNACTTVYDTIMVQVNPLPSIVTSNDTSICDDDTIKLYVSGSPGYSYQWSNGASSDSIALSEAGKYWVSASLNGCSVADTIHVSGISELQSTLPGDTIACLDDELVLNATHLNADDYMWQDGTTDPVYKISEDGKYWVTLSNVCNSYTDTINVEFKSCEIVVPNVITPNGDGVNETFKVKGIEGESWSFMIFNRWGQKLFETSHYTNDWDGGENISDGTYYYILKSNDGSGRSFTGYVQVLGD